MQRYLEVTLKRRSERRAINLVLSRDPSNFLQDALKTHVLYGFEKLLHQGHLNDVALAVATHMLIPVELSPKSLTGANALLSWHRGACKNLRLNPPLQILGFVPTKYDSNEAAQRDLLSQLPEMLAPLKIKCYPHIRYSCEFSNASGRGIPLHLHRPTHRAIKDLHPICEELSAILTEGKDAKKGAK